MKRSPIASSATRLLTPLLLVFSVFLLLRGHYEPGGGFVGGLVAGASFALPAFTDGVQRARLLLRAEPARFAAVGLCVALVSGLPGLVAGAPFLTGAWLPEKVPAIGSVGTPLLFDLGVYLVVLGAVTGVVFTLLEEEA